MKRNAALLRCKQRREIIMPNIDIYTFEPLLLHQITEVTGTSNVKKGHSYLEIEGLDRYLTLPTNLVPKVQACLAKCDGYHTLARILENADSNDRDALQFTLLKLTAMGAFQDEYTIAQATEIRALSIDLFSFDLTKFTNILARSFTPILVISAIIWTFLIGCTIQSALQGTLDFGVHIGSASDFIAVSALTYGISCICAMIHELMHSMFAAHYGFPPARTHVIIYFFVYPMFYVKIPRLYSADKKVRALILSAGLICQCFLGGVAIGIYSLTGNPIWFLIFLVNLDLLLGNAMPSSLTDGYFILSTLINEPNLRQAYLRKVSSWGTQRFRCIHLTKIQTIYTWSCIAFILVFNVIQANITTALFSIPTPYDQFFIIGLTLWSMIIYFVLIKYRFHRLEQQQTGQEDASLNPIQKLIARKVRAHAARRAEHTSEKESSGEHSSAQPKDKPTSSEPNPTAQR
jgi:Zn-dependent protease